MQQSLSPPCPPAAILLKLSLLPYHAQMSTSKLHATPANEDAVLVRGSNPMDGGKERGTTAPAKPACAARWSRRFAALCCLVSLALALVLGLALGLGLSAAKSSGSSRGPVEGISLELGVPSLDSPSLLADAGGVATAFLAAVSSLAPGGDVPIVRVVTNVTSGGSSVITVGRQEDTGRRRLSTDTLCDAARSLVSTTPIASRLNFFVTCGNATDPEKCMNSTTTSLQSL
jgi:hypothetical protein